MNTHIHVVRTALFVRNFGKVHIHTPRDEACTDLDLDSHRPRQTRVDTTDTIQHDVPEQSIGLGVSLCVLAKAALRGYWYRQVCRMAALQRSLAAFQSSSGKVARIIHREGLWFDSNMVPSTRTGRVLCLPSLADEGFDLGGVFAVVCLATTVGCPLLRWLKLPRHLKCVCVLGGSVLRPESRSIVLKSGEDFSGDDLGFKQQL